MKILLLVVCVAALGAVGGAIYIGVRLKEPTVVADPYQAGLHYDEHRHAAASAATSPPASATTPSTTACDLQSGPCKQPLPSGGEVTLSIGPRPVRAMQDLEFTVTVTPASAAAGAEVAIVLTMPGMYMGETRAALAPAGEGVFRGKGVVVRCSSGRRDWNADVLVIRDGGAALKPRQQGPRVARFPLTVAE